MEETTPKVPTISGRVVKESMGAASIGFDRVFKPVLRLRMNINTYSAPVSVDVSASPLERFCTKPRVFLALRSSKGNIIAVDYASFFLQFLLTEIPP